MPRGGMGVMNKLEAGGKSPSRRGMPRGGIMGPAVEPLRKTHKNKRGAESQQSTQVYGSSVPSRTPRTRLIRRIAPSVHIHASQSGSQGWRRGRLPLRTVTREDTHARVACRAVRKDLPSARDVKRASRAPRNSKWTPGVLTLPPVPVTMRPSCESG